MREKLFELIANKISVLKQSLSVKIIYIKTKENDGKGGGGG